jgi:LAS superfamily LD-carboxypeptidase LdcB
MVLTIVAAGTGAQTDSCRDSVAIGDSTYAVPEIWCGCLVDTSLLADPTSLVRVSDEFAYEDYGIYLTRETRDAFTALAQAATKDNSRLVARSGYRSSRYQKKLIVRRMSEGKSFAEVARFVAPPGYSTHETGQAIDISVPDEDGLSFAESRAYQWLLDNAAGFGFGETYPKDAPDGLPWEPWHWQYVDSLVAEATAVKDTSAPVPD